MGRIILYSIGCLVLMSQQVKSETFVCDIKKILAASDNGSFGANPYTDSLGKRHNRVSWDTISGSVRLLHSDGSKPTRTIQMQSLQKGNHEKSAIGMSIVKGIASTVVDMINIYTWRKDNPFFLIDAHAGIVFSGNCYKL